MAWNDTQDGFFLQLSWEYLRDNYTRVIPGHIDTLRNAAYRALEG